MRDANKTKNQLITELATARQKIAELKQAEEEIRKFKVIADSAPYGVGVAGLDGIVTYVNESFARMHSYTTEEIIGQHFSILYTKEQLEVFTKLREQCLKTDSFVAEEVWRKRKDGSVFPSSMTMLTVKDDKGNPLYLPSVVIDLTERKKMEAQLIQTSRLATVGELVAGVAHELNNPLTSIIGLSDLLMEREIPADIKEDLTIINQEAHRTAKIVQNLLTFARRQPQEKQPVAINKLIEAVLELRAYEQKINNIEVITQFATDLPEIMADGFQLQQVFLNIIINAEYFMIEAHKGGTLTITTERVGDIVRASLADDGPGIPKENLGRIFDPFFTTKEAGKGTGLGLSICHGIVTAQGGRISAESELGKGATFIVELPIS